MPTEAISFFSSDARDQYRGDVFRVLALPQKYTIHFRYQKKHINSEILQNLPALIGKKGVIFFATGNDLNIKRDERNITFHSIREVIIRDIKTDSTVDLVNFYLELGNFIDCHPLPEVKKEKLPPYESVAKIMIQDGPNNSWKDRVDQIKEFFPNVLFYYIGSIKLDEKELVPTFSSKDKSSFFNLEDESEYQIEVSFFDPTGGNLGLEQTGIDDSIMLVDIPKPHRVGTMFDSTIFNIVTHTISQKNVFAKTRLQQNLYKGDLPDLSNELSWKISRGYKKVFLFFLASIFATLGVSGVAIASKDLAGLSFTCLNIIVGFISIILIGLSATILYHSFNKK
ncbi:MAG: hypothetical protein HPY85_13365 [Anaerolineae bacterium]|nr:hypothetical protein [Anaerolineae bacterium]